jgi:hypothetical protein
MIQVDGFDLEASKFHTDSFVFFFPRFSLYAKDVTIIIRIIGSITVPLLLGFESRYQPFHSVSLTFRFCWTSFSVRQ